MTKLGFKHTPESIERMRRSATGKRMSPEARAKMSAAKRGVPKSAQWKESMRISWLTRRKYKNQHEKQLAQYGINLDDYGRMYAAQDGRCAICEVAFDRLAVDHDHVTGRVRGLVCGPCNLVLGHIEKFHRMGALARAVDYLGVA